MDFRINGAKGANNKIAVVVEFGIRSRKLAVSAPSGDYIAGSRAQVVEGGGMVSQACRVH